MSSQPDAERKAWLASLSRDELRALEYHWPFWGRPSQQAPPGDWRTWLVMAGRGFGKTRLLCEWARGRVESNTCRRLAFVAPTAADARDVLVEGESGILAISPPHFRPLYEPSKRRLTWPNGAIATTYSADESDRLRGPQHDGAICDEIAAWKYPESWDMLMFGLRLGPDPRVAAATTPKPVRLIRDLIKQPTTALTRGSTYENASNLAPAFLDQIIDRYEGTRLGRQEIAGDLLEDIPGALWERKRIDDTRRPAPADLIYTVVAIDPATTSEEGSDLTGIVVAAKGKDGHGYVLADLTRRDTPDGWARAAVRAYETYGANRIVAEVNQGGEMVRLTLKTVDPYVPYKAVHASKGKRARAEPVAALYEQGKVHHCATFPDLEDQMVSFTPDTTESPDRVDALVWALSDLLIAPRSWGGHS